MKTNIEKNSGYSINKLILSEFSGLQQPEPKAGLISAPFSGDSRTIWSYLVQKWLPGLDPPRNRHEGFSGLVTSPKAHGATLQQ